MSLFTDESAYQPLAARMRPRCVEEIVGQEHLLDKGKPLREAIDSSTLHSMLLWGPPGVGKTTLARMIAAVCDVHFEAISAVLSGVKDIRQAISIARQYREEDGRQTLLFVDEAHRFNKSQQDAFLPHVEDGTVIFVGATTENPSFELNNALLSRTRVYKLQSISEPKLEDVLTRALESDAILKSLSLEVEPEALRILARAADGDARRALNLLEVACDLTSGVLTEAIIGEVLGTEIRRFDKSGDVFYEQISALHKAVRGSSPDAALYWFARMMDGGCDPLYIARRAVRMASEDIGNADPRALQIALNAWDVVQRLGSPEGELALAQSLVFMATAAKSNALYTAFSKATDTVKQTPSFDVPLHIRNASTTLMQEFGYGKDYQYAHDFDDAFVAGESYLPEALHDSEFYHPVSRGLEIRIAEKLDYLRKMNAESDFQRYKKDS
ncbi:MAG: replication-associated recombination protein A [Pseudomonadales bacterium]|nr:replication-associated recombination protein A [Pseudomonadales bacterium]